MLQVLKQKLTGIKKVAGVEALHLPDGKVAFILSLLALEKGVVKCLAKHELTSIADIRTHLEGDTPVILTVTGKGILHRKLAAHFAREDDLQVLQAVFPNASQEDLYLQKFALEHAVFAAVARRTVIDGLLEGFNAEGMFVIGLYLGPIATLPLVPLMQEQQIMAGYYTIVRVDDQIQDVKAGNQEEAAQKVGDELIPSRFFNAFAASFNVFLPDQSLDFHEGVRLKRAEWQEKRMFTLMGWSTLGMFMLILFINLICFFTFSKQNDELAGMNSLLIANVKKMEQLEKDVAEKEKFLKNAGWLDHSRISFYADRIAATVPATVSLTGLRVHPYNDALSKKEKKPVFDNGTIILAGTCQHPVVINPWLNDLKKLDWVAHAGNKSYFYDQRESIGVFELIIEIKKDAK